MTAARRLTISERRRLRASVTNEVDRLDEQIQTLTRSFDDIVAAADLMSTDDEHDPEGTTIAFERAQVSALLRQATLDRNALRAALTKVGDAGFGACELCAEFIGTERLMALPSATRCVECAR